MNRKLICALLSLAMLLPLTACSETTSADDTESQTPGADSEAVEVEEEADEMAALLADLPTGSYDGFEFAYVNNISNFAYTSMAAEELTGEAINDAFFNRNNKVCEDLNITMREELVDYGVVTSTMNTNITAGDETYSAFWNESKFVAPFASDGKLLNVYSISSLNLDKPWWYRSVMDQATINGREYFLVGDVHLMFKESYWMCGFNKNILDDFQLGDPYELVREGVWTLDKMKEYMEAVGSDTNGDGKMDGEDLFGVTSYDGCFAPLFLASGEGFFVQDENGVPSLAEYGDRFYSVYDKVYNTVFAPELRDQYVCLSGKTPNMDQYGDSFHGVFRSGHSLFYLEPIGSLKKLREMEAEFGILPCPKYEESQSDYHGLIAGYGAFCGIPITCSDPERTGVILENLCGLSYGELRDAYVSTTLNFKYIRDQESREMLDIIFAAGNINIGDVFGVNLICENMITAASNGNADIASTLSKAMKAASKTVEKTIGKLTSLDH